MGKIVHMFKVTFSNGLKLEGYGFESTGLKKSADDDQVIFAEGCEDNLRDLAYVVAHRTQPSTGRIEGPEAVMTGIVFLAISGYVAYLLCNRSGTDGK